MVDLSVIDRKEFDRMLAVAGGDPEMMAELLNTFFEDAPGYLATLHRALAQGDAKGVYMAAHSLKSNSAGFGALALAEACRALELEGKAGQLGGAAARIAEIEAAYERAKAALEAICAGLGGVAG